MYVQTVAITPLIINAFDEGRMGRKMLAITTD
jgi:hypothetical protein